MRVPVAGCISKKNFKNLILYLINNSFFREREKKNKSKNKYATLPPLVAKWLASLGWCTPLLREAASLKGGALPLLVA
jgi:hypothetical protein